MLKYSAKWSALLVSVALIAGGSQIAVAADKPFAEKKIVLQISDPNPFKQTLVLNVASNIIKEYGVDNVTLKLSLLALVCVCCLLIMQIKAVFRV